MPRNKRREVPLHPHLVEQGFLMFVEASGQGPVFYDPNLARTGSRANPQYAKVGNKIGDWVRDIGVKDPEVQPNHGWRHTFQQIALSVRMDPEIRVAIKGTRRGPRARSIAVIRRWTPNGAKSSWR